ncbi:MAG TPA: WecB/TagA/CpsF family glycosyltransferase [Candidatus Acidoferrales bacterium]|nr:WecB/TagA/CpsF family glycosyltransferase [Candidatus Acidoferrales bacterium]
MRRLLCVLGVSIDALQIPSAIGLIEDWIRERSGCHFVAVTGMHGITEAHYDPEFKHILNSADMVVPDGMPLVWLARRRGHQLKRRVYGPELMLTFFQETVSQKYRHFLYGGEPGLPEKLAQSLQQRFPGTIIAGTYSPPFRPLTPDEDMTIVEMINSATPDVVWVGLSTPKQERWMYAHRERLNAPVLIGVGAAFDINSGAKNQAPRWMREHGFEWLFRLLQEPRRLWRRYLIYGSKFLFWVLLEEIGLREHK